MLVRTKTRGMREEGAEAAIADAPPYKYRVTQGVRCSHMYGHLRTPSAEYTHTRGVVHSLQGGTDWPTYSGSSTAVSHALNWSGLSIIILGGFRVTIWHRRPRGHTLVTRGATSEREVSTLLDEDSRHSEISRCCIDMESRVSRRRAI